MRNQLNAGSCSPGNSGHGYRNGHNTDGLPVDEAISSAETLAAVLHRPFGMTREKNITCHGLLAPDRSGRSYGGIVPSEYLAPGGLTPAHGPVRECVIFSHVLSLGYIARA